MAARVRFLSLTLAGFGRYDRPTRFDLDGRSCSFTSANELGKSTFHAGLLATLFGPPPIKAKLQAFAERFRSWNRPPWFWGEVDFAVSDDRLRVRRDFDSHDLKVWRIGRDNFAELRYEERVKPGRKLTDPDPYTRLLEDWLGIGDRAVYEAMFTVSQETSLSTAWQIDPRIADLVYGPSVRRVAASLHELYDRVREITRNTREFQISLGAGGERGGRADGRCDEIVARIAEMETTQAVAREKSRQIAEHRSRRSELETRCEQLRQALTGTQQSLDAWRSWIELESRLRPAVESYERLHALNQRCQQVTRPLGELRTRLAGELAIFDAAPEDLADQLEYLPLLAQAVEDARKRQADETGRRDWLAGELRHWQESLAAEFAEHRGRPELPDQVEELRLVRDELACVRNRLNELNQLAADPARDAAQVRLNELEPWRRLGPDWPARLDQARQFATDFAARRAEFTATSEIAAVESNWVTDHAAKIVHADAVHRELEQSRANERAAIASQLAELQALLEAAHRAKESLDAARRDLEQRYVDFAGAPANLLELWDSRRAAEARVAESRGMIDHARETQQQLDRRTYWRRGLTALGGVVTVTALIFGSGWSRWIGMLVAAGISASLRWVYRIDSAESDASDRGLRDAQAEQLRLTGGLDAVVAELGQGFAVPAEREAEWRRLWPAYRRELERIETELRQLPNEEQLAEASNRARAAGTRLDGFDAETKDLLGESSEALDRSRAELVRRENELARLREQFATHCQRFFAASEDSWRAQPTNRLPDDWWPVIELNQADAAASGHGPEQSRETVADLVSWCVALDEYSWDRFAENCREVDRLQTVACPDPEAEAARLQAVDEAESLERSLKEQEFRLADTIAPFTTETDVAWLRERAAACCELERRIAERELELETVPTAEDLAADVERAAAQQAETVAALEPFLGRFDNDPARLLAARAGRHDAVQQISDLERQAAELVAESGFVTLEELAHEAGKAEGLVATIRAESQELLSKNVELWDAVDAPPGLAAERAGELDARRAEQQASLDATERERADAAATIRQLDSEPSTDEATLEIELNALRAERAELEKRRDQIVAEFHEASRLMQELKRVERTALEGRITAFFADFSRTAGRRVELDDELRLRLQNDDGTRYAPDQLSHGARDQLYLAVYLATTAGLDLPFILDDPFVNCDAERLAAIRACWDSLTPDHQLILLSHDPRLAAWAPALEVRDAA